MCEAGLKLCRVSLLMEQRAEQPKVILATPPILNQITQSQRCWGEHVLRVPALRLYGNISTFWKGLKTSCTDGTDGTPTASTTKSSTTKVVVQQLRSHMPQTHMGLTHQGNLNEKCLNMKGWCFIYTLRGAFTPCHRSKSVKGTLYLQSSIVNHFIFPGAFAEFESQTDLFYTRQRRDKNRERSSKTATKPGTPELTITSSALTA